MVRYSSVRSLGDLSLQQELLGGRTQLQNAKGVLRYNACLHRFDQCANALA